MSERSRKHKIRGKPYYHMIGYDLKYSEPNEHKNRKFEKLCPQDFWPGNTWVWTTSELLGGKQRAPVYVLTDPVEGLTYEEQWDLGNFCQKKPWNWGKNWLLSIKNIRTWNLCRRILNMMESLLENFRKFRFTKFKKRSNFDDFREKSRNWR